MSGTLWCCIKPCDMRNVVYFGSVQDSRETAPMRISFIHIPDLELGQD